jgi:plasmid stabilization system protein ParE
MDFNISHEAKLDLFEIQDFIAQDNISMAEKVVNEIFDVFEKLSKNPFMGHRRSDLTDEDVRFFSIYSYLIIYNATTKPISIIRVLSGFRDIQSIIQKI